MRAAAQLPEGPPLYFLRGFLWCLEEIEACPLGPQSPAITARARKMQPQPSRGKSLDRSRQASSVRAVVASLRLDRSCVSNRATGPFLPRHVWTGPSKAAIVKATRVVLAMLEISGLGLQSCSAHAEHEMCYKLRRHEAYNANHPRHD